MDGRMRLVVVVAIVSLVILEILADASLEGDTYQASARGPQQKGKNKNGQKKGGKKPANKPRSNNNQQRKPARQTGKKQNVKLLRANQIYNGLQPGKYRMLQKSIVVLTHRDKMNAQRSQPNRAQRRGQQPKGQPRRRGQPRGKPRSAVEGMSEKLAVAPRAYSFSAGPRAGCLITVKCPCGSIHFRNGNCIRLASGQCSDTLFVRQKTINLNIMPSYQFNCRIFCVRQGQAVNVAPVDCSFEEETTTVPPTTTTTKPPTTAKPTTKPPTTKPTTKPPTTTTKPPIIIIINP